MKILACAIGFGLGPSGKLCSIIEANNEYEWFGCGDPLDLSIYKNNPFKGSCWGRDKNQIYRFITMHEIKYAVVILDPEIAIFLTEIGLKVIYVDSLPFIWNEADILPYQVYCYCAQDYPDRCMNHVMEKIENLIWIKPIIPVYSFKSMNSSIVINFGGLHSPFGEGAEYYKLIMKAILPCFPNEKIIVTGGKNVISLTKSLYPFLQCATYPHDEFINIIAASEIFITSPGLTTIYETCSMKINTIVLPPQNLSQFYNSEIAKRICHNILVLNWNENKLSCEYLRHFCNKPEEEAVRFIYNQIKRLSKDNDYIIRFSKYVSDTIAHENYISNNNIEESTGLCDVSDILHQMTEH